jgi:hypothetical protein
VQRMHQVIAVRGTDPKDWLPHFLPEPITQGESHAKF